MLTAQGASVTLIDSNPVQIERTASFGRKVYYGDGRRVDLLRRAGAAEATLIIYCVDGDWLGASVLERSEEHTSELQSLMRISYAVFCLKKKNHKLYN